MPGLTPPAPDAGRTLPADAALLRVCGLPGRLWLAAATPEVFAAAEWLDAAADRLRAAAVPAAARIGRELVPQPGLPAADRARALAVRRALHAGGPADPAALDAVAAAADRLPSTSELAAELRGLAGRQRELAAAEAAFPGAVDAAAERMLAAGWRVARHSPVAWRALTEANPEALTDIANRVRAGEPWTAKRLRQRAEYLWRMVERGATRATPRGWLAHVALLPLEPAAPPGPLPPLTASYAIERSANVHLAMTAADPDAADAVLTLAPLCEPLAERTRCWVVRPEDPGRLRELTVRTTPELAAIQQALRGGPLGLAELRSAVAAAAGHPPGQAVFDRLVRHLTGLGVLAVSRRPQWTVSGWRGAVAQLPAAGAGGYVDVYRQPGGSLPLATGAELARLLGTALRVLAVLDTDEPPPPAESTPDGWAQPRPLLDLVAADVAAAYPPGTAAGPAGASAHAAGRTSAGPAGSSAGPGGGADPGGAAGRAGGGPGGEPGEAGHRHDWPPVRDPDSPYGRLHAWLTARLPAGPVDLDAVLAGPDRPAGLLDRPADPAGATNRPADPADGPDWPADCLLRPLWTDGVAPWSVLDRIEPAGVLDARFADGLAALYPAGGTARSEWYRDFLHAVEEETGGVFVELLAPSLSDRAANAVRRPVYTGHWTGDPDLYRYCRPGPGRPPRFIPLAEITVRYAAGRPVVEAGGRPIWPVYHATRQLPPPWDAVATRLLGTGPAPPRSRWRSLRYSLPAWPDREYLPRITVGGGTLVLTCAQWRVDGARLWPVGAPLAAKVRALDRLRRQLDLPRWVTVAATRHDEPTACDLRSLHSVATVDRLLRRRPARLYVAELLPAPDRPPVLDTAAEGTGGSAAELLLRLPLGVPPGALAARVAAAYSGRASPLATVH